MPFRFGPFRLDPIERSFTHDGEPVEVQGQVFDLILLLLERPGSLWTREELHKRLWPEAIVSEDALFQAMAKARKALGDSSRSPRWLATVAGQGYRFVGTLEAEGEPATPVVSPLAPSISPSPTSFVGRNAQRDQLLAAIGATPGMWTLTGPGGTGKTRLSMEVGARAPHGAIFCDLQAVEEGGAIWVSIGRALQLAARVPDEPEAVAAALCERGPLLLILDNGEQVAQALAEVCGILRRHAPASRLLVTSRIRLGTAGEQLVDLAPLALPEPGATLAELQRSAAGELLLDRARAAAGWEPSPGDLPDLVALTRALGGLPLAIELAAPRLRLLSPGQLLARMDRQLDLLGSRDPGRPGRHATLRSAITASWELLDPPHQQALAQLSVFAGPFAAEAGEASLGLAGADPFLALAELIDHSLLRRREDRPERPLLELLPSIRQFACGHLDPTDRTATLDRMARWYASAAEAAGPEDLAAWQAGKERDSLILAFDHAFGHGLDEIAAAIARTLARTLLEQGPLHELPTRLGPLRRRPGLGALDRTRLLLLEVEACLASTEVEAAGRLLDEAEAALPASGPLVARAMRLRAAWHYRRGAIAEVRLTVERGLALPDLPGAERAQMLLVRGQTETFALQPQAAMANLEEARALVEALDLRVLRAELFYELGCAQLSFVGLESGRERLAQSLASAQEQGNPVAAARAQGMLGRALLHLGRRVEACRALDAAEPVLRHAGLTYELGNVIDSRGHLALAEGNLTEARTLLVQAIALFVAAGQTRAISDPRVTLAAVLIRLGDLDAAEEQLLAALDHFEQQGRNQGMVLHNLGEVDLRRGRHDRARERLLAARQAHEASGKQVSVAMALATLGEIELAAGSPTAAVPPLTESVAILRTRERNDILAECLGWLGLALGLCDRAAEADAVFEEIEAMPLGPHGATTRAQAFAKRAQLALHRGQPAVARALGERAWGEVEGQPDADLRGALIALDQALGVLLAEG